MWPRRRARDQAWQRNEAGAIAIYVALMLPFLVGLALLVVDGGRLFNLDTSLQNNVDALALAGAAELDKRPDSRTRAAAAMQAFITSNKQIFGSGASRITVAFNSTTGDAASASGVEWCWLKTIPADKCKLDLTVSSSGACSINSTSAGTECSYELSTNPATTNFIWVRSRASAGGFANLFPVALVNGKSTSALRRVAVAGMNRAVCKPTPLMICNPWETTGTDSIDTVPELRTKIGSITTAREYGGGSAEIGPGEFGLLDPSEVIDSCGGGSGGIVTELTWQLAGSTQTSCQTRNGLCPKTGVVAALDKAVNSRFDIYEGSIGSYLTSDPIALVPAARTIWNNKDADATACKRTGIEEDTSGNAPGSWFPRDAAWDRVAYFSQQPYYSANPTLHLASNSITLPNGKTKTVGTLTRYEAYLWEADKAKAMAVPGSPYTKSAANTCYASKVTGGTTILNTVGIDGRTGRRDLYVALTNCLELKAAIAAGAPYSLNGASTTVPLPSLAVAKFFITEPINRTFGSDISSSNVPNNVTNGWPTTNCTVSAAYTNRRYFDVSATGFLEAGRIYYFTTNFGTTLEAAFPTGTVPTVQDLVTGFTASATAESAPYAFCYKTSPSRFYIATSEALTGAPLKLGKSIPGADKRIFMELADVYAADNGADVTRDVVRLYR
jgi:Flp pilus assembly protein TadG